MANLNFVFYEYNKAIRLPEVMRNELKNVRDNLRLRLQVGYGQISEEFNFQHGIDFQSQGSFVMDTIIRPLHDDYDLDDGVYFIGNLPSDSRPSPTEFHRWVCQALGVRHEDIEEVIDKETCVRVRYKAGFHVDLPIYYATSFDAPELADKGRGWILSHPVEFIAWFEKKIESGFQTKFLTEAKLYPEFEKWVTDIRKTDHQLRRIVRYFKAWADLRREDMPCGIIMTILAANCYSPHERDDIALKETLVNVQAALKKEFKCERPTTPAGEDLLSSYNNKDAFMTYLGYFVENAKKGLQEQDNKYACRHWQNSLGDRFPCQIVKDDHKEATATVTGLVAGTLGRKPWGGIEYDWK